MKDIQEYPFLNWLYNYLEDNNYFNSNDITNENEKEIYKVFENSSCNFNTFFELECHINALEREYHSRGFLWGYMTAANMINRIDTCDKHKIDKVLSGL